MCLRYNYNNDTQQATKIRAVNESTETSQMQNAHQDAGSGAVGRPEKYHSTKSVTPKNSGSEGEIWTSAPPRMPPRDEPMKPKKL